MKHANEIIATDQERLEAFQYLSSLPPYNRKEDEGEIIDPGTALNYATTFRNTTNAFTIPLAWCMDIGALTNMLGITSYSGQPAVSGIRFYAGINENNQLTLIAVTTTNNADGTDDLTVNDGYPYYDYAYPCPNLCSSTGNLAVSNPNMSNFIFERTSSQ